MATTHEVYNIERSEYLTQEEFLEYYREENHLVKYMHIPSQPKLAMRSCLKCGVTFTSEHAGNRICKRCKYCDSVWRSELQDTYLRGENCDETT